MEIKSYPFISRTPTISNTSAHRPQMALKWPGLLGVSGGTAIFTGTLDELGLHITLGTSNVPVPGAHRLGIPGLVMLQGRLVLVQIPRRLPQRSC